MLDLAGDVEIVGVALHSVVQLVGVWLAVLLPFKCKSPHGTLGLRLVMLLSGPRAGVVNYFRQRATYPVLAGC